MKAENVNKPIAYLRIVFIMFCVLIVQSVICENYAKDGLLEKKIGDAIVFDIIPYVSCSVSRSFGKSSQLRFHCSDIGHRICPVPHTTNPRKFVLHCPFPLLSVRKGFQWIHNATTISN